MFFAIANTVIRTVGDVITPIISFVWNLNTNQWQGENRTWNNP